jgi:hypothetical protein
VFLKNFAKILSSNDIFYELNGRTISIRELGEAYNVAPPTLEEVMYVNCEPEPELNTFRHLLAAGAALRSYAYDLMARLPMPLFKPGYVNPGPAQDLQSILRDLNKIKEAVVGRIEYRTTANTLNEASDQKAQTTDTANDIVSPPLSDAPQQLEQTGIDDTPTEGEEAVWLVEGEESLLALYNMLYVNRDQIMTLFASLEEDWEGQIPTELPEQYRAILQNLWAGNKVDVALDDWTETLTFLRNIPVIRDLYDNQFTDPYLVHEPEATSDDVNAFVDDGENIPVDYDCVSITEERTS